MRRLIATVFTLCFLIGGFASLVQANPTIKKNFDLPHRVSAMTVVEKANPQNVMVTFTNQNGVLGTVALSPTHQKLQNLIYQLGDQKIKIDSIEVNNSGDPNSGAVVLNCKISDTTGWNKRPFKGMIASWSR